MYKSQFFNLNEFKCRCGNCSGFPNSGIDTNLLELLDMIRIVIKKPIYITSGYRCPDWNREVGGVPNSQHVQGIAADIIVDDIEVEVIAQIAENCLAEMGVEGGVGRYPSQGFVHVDTRGYTAKWSEDD